MPDACLFCGSGVASNEHVVSRWVGERLREISPPTPEHGAITPIAANASRHYMSKLIEIKVRAPCRTCNSEFFNELEGPCRPFLAEAMADRPGTLDADGKRDLATYAYKTALLLSLHVTPRKQWPRSIIDQCGLLYQIRRPPVGVRTWIGRFDVRDNFPDMMHGGRFSDVLFKRKGSDYLGHQVIYTFGYLLFFVVFWDARAPDDFVVEKERLAPESLLGVWPAFVEFAKWPPPVSITYARLNELSNWNVDNWPHPSSTRSTFETGR